MCLRGPSDLECAIVETMVRDVGMTHWRGTPPNRSIFFNLLFARPVLREMHARGMTLPTSAGKSGSICHSFRILVMFRRLFSLYSLSRVLISAFEQQRLSDEDFPRVDVPAP